MNKSHHGNHYNDLRKYLFQALRKPHLCASFVYPPHKDRKKKINHLANLFTIIRKDCLIIPITISITGTFAHFLLLQPDSLTFDFFPSNFFVCVYYKCLQHFLWKHCQVAFIVKIQGFRLSSSVDQVCQNPYLNESCWMPQLLPETKFQVQNY